MKKKFISIFALAMIFSVGTTAQVDSTAHVQQKVMTLKECMEYAVDNSTKNKVQQLDNADARIKPYSKPSHRVYLQIQTHIIISDVR